MAWDSSRPVPWRRLIREWLIYIGIMAVLFVVFFRENSLGGILAGLLVSGPLYLGFGYVLAKFGYQRKTLGEARAQSKSTRSGQSSDSSSGAGSSAPARPRPAPTKRTGGGAARPGGGRKR